jgi:hypothetical protein
MRINQLSKVRKVGDYTDIAELKHGIFRLFDPRGLSRLEWECVCNGLTVLPQQEELGGVNGSLLDRAWIAVNKVIP